MPDLDYKPGQQPQGGEEIVLGGCTPVPLAAYLKAIGIHRMVARQKDPHATGYWRDEVFILRTELTESGLRDFIAYEYTPTPIIAPWNGGSGFYAKDNKSGIDPISQSATERFADLRTAIAQARQILQAAGIAEKPDENRKPELITWLRAEAPESLLDWIDAAIVLTDEGPKYPPLLGTGGNDGRLDFTNNFMQRLLEVIDPDTGSPVGKARPLLDLALFGEASPALVKRSIGQFMPGAAGGPNAGTGFEAESRVNPWDFILMLEGALLFAATATRRQAQFSEGELSYPFTVRPTGSGAGATALEDEGAARAEIWMPLWEDPLTLGELAALLGEGRVTLNRGFARDGLDFARAVAALGVDRGIEAFQRYAFMMRSGKAYLATPLNRVPVRRNPSANLIDQLERNQFLQRFRRYARSGPGRARILARRLEDALFELARHTNEPEQERPRRIQSILTCLGEIVFYLSASPDAREKCPRLPWLDSDWITGGDDASNEFRIAAALAGLGCVNLPILCHLLPVTVKDPTRLDQETRLVTWRRGPLPANLGETLVRRLLEAEYGNWQDKPLAGHPGVTDEAIAALLEGQMDEERVSHLMAGMALVSRPPYWLPRAPGNRPALPAAYRLLKPLFTTDKQLRACRLIRDGETLPLPMEIPALLRANRPGEAVKRGLRRLRASGITPRFHDASFGGLAGPRLLAALIVPVTDDAIRALRSIVRPIDEERDSTKPSEGSN